MTARRIALLRGIRMSGRNKISAARQRALAELRQHLVAFAGAEATGGGTAPTARKYAIIGRGARGLIGPA